MTTSSNTRIASTRSVSSSPSRRMSISPLTAIALDDTWMLAATTNAARPGPNTATPTISPAAQLITRSIVPPTML